METKNKNTPGIPQEARFVIYKLPNTSSSMEITFLNDTDEVKQGKVEKTWKSIRENGLENSYGVIFKDEKNNILPLTYIIRGELKDILSLQEDDADDSFEEAQASQALGGTGLTSYIKADLADILAFIPFDQNTMVIVGEEEIKTPQSIPYTPIRLPDAFSALRRSEAFFTQQGMNQKNIHEQPFIPRSDEQASIDFMEEYYRYCCNPIEYPGTEVHTMPYDGTERFDITPEVLKNMEKKNNKAFSELKVYSFFKKQTFRGTDTYRPSLDVLCHMYLMNCLASLPIWLSTGHLGNPEKATAHLEYYTSMLIHNDPHVIPNQAGLIEILKRIITVIKKTPGRFMELEIDVAELVDLLAKGPYETLIRDQLSLVNNITEGDTVGFKLTPTGALFLYMCCPNIQ